MIDTKNVQQEKKFICPTVLLCLVLLMGGACKEAIYAPVKEDTIRLAANPIAIEPGEMSTITVTGVKANGRPMPDNTVVILTADSGTFQDQEEGVDAILLEGGGIKTVTYQSDASFTGEAVTITANAGAAAVKPEQLVITIAKVEVTQLFIIADPLKLPPGGGTAKITVTAYDANTVGVPGALIFLETTAGKLLKSSPLVTGPDGKVEVELQTTEPATVTATYKEIAKSIEIGIQENLPPVAAFTFSPRNPRAGETVRFNPEASADPDGEEDIVSYEWDLGDDQDAVAKSGPEIVEHIYDVTEEKVFTVTLTVKDKKRAESVTTAEITVRPSPVARLSFTPDEPVVNEPVTFYASESEGDIKTYEWYLGDGEHRFTAAPVIMHAYAAAREYRVVLKVTDINNRTSTIVIKLTVKE